MNSFIVSARKYRPSRFSQIRAQLSITTTLCNQLKSNKVPQVFLFCGPRGSGKTSCARILAKAINCEVLSQEGEPCDTCRSCTQFQAHTSTNIYELDAASNNSVEDVRQILEQVRYHPPYGKKIFIIDEVHMLSNAAFNSLLKTLEEPPSHVVFILATTEKQKIIPTILSRCQIFDFRSIPDSEIIAQLQYIAQKEGITSDEEALHLISEQSEGSFREALHAFDKILAFGGGKQLTKEAVLRHLQIIDQTYYFKITNTLYKGNYADVLQAYDQILRLGFQNQHFLKGLTKHIRNLLVAKTSASKELLQASLSLVESYQTQAKKIDTPFLYEGLTLLEQCELHYKERQDKRLHIELTLIKIAYLKAPLSPSTHATTSSDPLPPTKKESKKDLDPIVPIQISPKASKPLLAPLPKKKDIPKQPTSPSLATQKDIEETKKSLNLTQVTFHWKAFSQKLKEKGAISASVTMQSPITIKGDTIILEITNTLQKNALKSYHNELLTYLREKLNNASLQVTTEVQQVANSKTISSDSPLQIKHLVEKYPLIKTLQKALDLS